MDYKIPQEFDGRTVKEFLLQTIHPSSKLLKALKYSENGILLCGEQVTVRKLLHAGDLLSLALEDEEDSPKILPVNLPLPIAYEDDDLVVPAKPANMPTHPSKDHHGDTVANALAYRYRENGVRFVFRPIQRLDRNTSGLLIVAKNRLAAGRLTKSMVAGKIQKEYLAILDGEWEVDCGRIEKSMHRTQESIILREICPDDTADADFAVTEFRVLAKENGHTLVLAHPLTGRTHQLRVHFASEGHPLTGDDLYGRKSEKIHRHALHACKLTFPHPTDGRLISLFAEPPEDFQSAAKICFSNYEAIIKEVLS